MKEEKRRAMYNAYRDALSVHDACNLVAVLGAWDKASMSIFRFEGTPSTEAHKSHPVNILFLSKVSSLMGLSDPTINLFRDAFAACEAKVEELKEEKNGN